MADISYCSNKKCDKVDCKRHLCNVPDNALFYCVSSFNEENKEECEDYWRVDI